MHVLNIEIKPSPTGPGKNGSSPAKGDTPPAAVQLGHLCYQRTPLVELVNDHELWLGFTGAGRPIKAIKGLAAEAVSGLGHCLRVGLAASKFTARAALLTIGDGGEPPMPRTARKAFRAGCRDLEFPGGRLRAVLAGREQDFLAPLPLAFLWPLDEAARERLARLGMETLGQVARLDRTLLIKKFGPEGGLIHDYARGLDPERVREAFPPPELVARHHADFPLTGTPAVTGILDGLGENLAGQLAARHEGCRHLSLVVTLDSPPSGQLSASRLFNRGEGTPQKLRLTLHGLWTRLALDHPVAGLEARAGLLTPCSYRQLELSPGLLAPAADSKSAGLAKAAGFASGPQESGRPPVGEQPAELLTRLRQRFPDNQLRLGQELAASRRERMLAFWDPFRLAGPDRS